jgi:hypothetical protein
MRLEKFSLGIGDRFGYEGQAQLRALKNARGRGLEITPVWNKSHREHAIIGSTPEDTRRRADEAIRACGWRGSYFVDADHISSATVDRFLDACDFFTIDISDHIGRPASPHSISTFIEAASRHLGPLYLTGSEAPLELTKAALTSVARDYLAAVEEAGRVYRRIAGVKGEANFIAEISLDEAAVPQTPGELFFILAAVSRQKMAVQTIAPRFSGGFLKGIDYESDKERFAREFKSALAAVNTAKLTLDLPSTLKLSIHSGSDKFSLYPIMREALSKAGAGLHLKTAGTTWLEEVIGLAAAGGDALMAVKEIYTGALARIEDLVRPYLAVVGIDRARLPPAEEVNEWTSRDFVEALRHEPTCPRFNPHVRQLIHIGYKIAAEMGSRFTDLLVRHREVIEAGVTDNLLRRHIEPLLLGR